jgi:RimJ/RimL family protein N-acetyltransferase
MEDLSQTHPTIFLRSGASALLRPLTADDRDRIREAYRRLSPESRYMRFWSRFRELNPQFIDQLLSPGETAHATWAILQPDKDDLPGIGAGSFWQLQGDLTSAEVSFTVADEFQDQGVGTILLAAIWLHATTLGIGRFVAHVLDSNLAMRTWWDALGASAIQTSHRWELTLLLDEALLSESAASRSLCDWLKRLSPLLQPPLGG